MKQTCFDGTTFISNWTKDINIRKRVLFEKVFAYGTKQALRRHQSCAFLLSLRTLVIRSQWTLHGCELQSTDHVVAMKWCDLDHRIEVHSTKSATWRERYGRTNAKWWRTWNCYYSQHHSHDRHSGVVLSVVDSSLSGAFVTRVQG